MIAAIDLFAGAGGLSLGAINAGLDVRLHVDTDPVACATLRDNADINQGTVVEADVCDMRGGDLRELSGISSEAFRIGGPSALIDRFTSQSKQTMLLKRDRIIDSSE